MCVECGCGQPALIRIDGVSTAIMATGLLIEPATDSARIHDPGTDHAPARREVAVHASIFAANDQMAARNRDLFHAQGVFVLNVVSAPGSGKTLLLTKTIERLRERAQVGVIVGDLETDNDATRLRTTGAPVVQITTGTLCHLDAEMVARAASSFDMSALDLIVVENVGNLVCPAEFDLGEDLRVALLSVTEGEDKPLKYPPLFRFADVVVLSKMDLATAVEFDRAIGAGEHQAHQPHRSHLRTVGAHRPGVGRVVRLSDPSAPEHT